MAALLVAGLIGPMIASAISVGISEFEKGNWVQGLGSLGAQLWFLPLYFLAVPLNAFGALCLVIGSLVIERPLGRYSLFAWLLSAVGIAALQLHLLFPNPRLQDVCGAYGSWLLVGGGLWFFCSPERVRHGRSFADTSVSEA